MTFRLFYSFMAGLLLCGMFELVGFIRLRRAEQGKGPESALEMRRANRITHWFTLLMAAGVVASGVALIVEAV